MQRIVYTQKPMRIPDRGCAARKRLELERRLTVAVVVTALVLLLTSAIVTGVRAAGISNSVEQLPSNVLLVPIK